MSGADLAAAYRRVAPIYDLWTRFTERDALLAAIDRLAIVDGAEVLEIAVGTGIVFEELLRRNRAGRTVGIDLTDAMIARTRRRAERVGAAFELAISDARTLSFADASFDRVITTNMLGLLGGDDIAKVFGEIARVLRPGGRVVVVTMKRPVAALPTAVYRIGAQWLGRWRDVDVAPIARAAGLIDVTTETIVQNGIPSEILVAERC